MYKYLLFSAQFDIKILITNFTQISEIVHSTPLPLHIEHEDLGISHFYCEEARRNTGMAYIPFDIKPGRAE